MIEVSLNDRAGKHGSPVYLTRPLRPPEQLILNVRYVLCNCGPKPCFCPPPTVMMYFAKYRHSPYLISDLFTFVGTSSGPAGCRGWLGSGSFVQYMGWWLRQLEGHPHWFCKNLRVARLILSKVKYFVRAWNSVQLPFVILLLINHALWETSTLDSSKIVGWAESDRNVTKDSNAEILKP